MTENPGWYIVQQPSGQCEIVPGDRLSEAQSPASDREQWGPFETPDEAIARRVGLIRAGKCKPA